MTQGNVYLDYNATSPIHSLVHEQVPLWLESWGNASSIHQHGRNAKKLVREARQKIARFFNVLPLEIIFTSGGSEANNFAIKSFLSPEIAKGRDEIITTRVEHPSVLQSVLFMEVQGFKIKYVDVDEDGAFDFQQYESYLNPKTLLVSIMTANNEMGAIFPIKKIAQLAQQQGAYVHTDAVQTVGRMPLDLQDLGVDLATFSGHKFYALKGSGILYCKRGTPLQSFISGGGQERGRRAGTENTLAIASMGAMIDPLSELQVYKEQMTQLRDHFEDRVLTEIPHVRVLAQNSVRLPNTSCLLIAGVHGESMLMSLDVKGFSVSTGAACSSGRPEPSHVLLAMGLSYDQAQTSLRVSLGWMTTREQIDQFVNTLKEVVEHLRFVARQGENRVD